MQNWWFAAFSSFKIILFVLLVYASLFLELKVPTLLCGFVVASDFCELSSPFIRGISVGKASKIISFYEQNFASAK